MRFLLLLLLPLFLATSGCGISNKEAMLAKLFEDVVHANGVVFDARDSDGRGMDCAKIIKDEGQGYIAVYHSYADPSKPQNGFQVYLATSRDLRSWNYIQSYGKNTHQPTIERGDDGSYVLAVEADNGSYNWLQIREYKNRSDLLANKPRSTRALPHTLVPPQKWAEGTPQIISLDDSKIEMGFHFFDKGDVDRIAYGTFNRKSGSWLTRPATSLNQAIINLGVRGNIGDRDSVNFEGKQYTFLEGQFVKRDFGSWRIFLWNGNKASQMNIRTPGGSQAFANPAVAIVPGPNGEPQVLLVSLFVPSENSAPGESGQLIYWSQF